MPTLKPRRFPPPYRAWFAVHRRRFRSPVRQDFSLGLASLRSAAAWRDCAAQMRGAPGKAGIEIAPARPGLYRRNEGSLSCSEWDSIGEWLDASEALLATGVLMTIALLSPRRPNYMARRAAFWSPQQRTFEPLPTTLIRVRSYRQWRGRTRRPCVFSLSRLNCCHHKPRARKRPP